MSAEKLEQILSKIARPSADPGRFREKVWREIRLRQTPASQGLAPACQSQADPGWPHPILAPALAALAAALVTAALQNPPPAKPAPGHPAETAAKALGLSVFSPGSKALAHNRLVLRK